MVELAERVAQLEKALIHNACPLVVFRFEEAVLYFGFLAWQQ